MAMSGPTIHRPQPDPARHGQLKPAPKKPEQAAAEKRASKLHPRPLADPNRASNLGLAAGIATVLYLLSSVVLGTQVSGLLGSNVFSAVFVVCFVVTMVTLLVAIVLDLILGIRGGQSSRTSLTLGLLLLLPPTGVAFYVVNQTLQG